MPGLHTSSLALILFASTSSLSAYAATYTVSDTFSGASFYDGFTALAIPDPTLGRVNYVDTPTSKSLNLTYAGEGHFVLRTDFQTVLTPTGPGRNSVRLSSNKQWSTSLVVADILHMPQGCGTWPAFWSFGNVWPDDGEIDILEGVNDQGPNIATLHTSPGCTMPAERTETGTPTGLDCSTAVAGNPGCGVKSADPNSYGPPFNTNGGGWYAMERTPTGISVWFWPRNSPTVPAAVSTAAATADTTTFGTPTAYFPNTSCDMTAHFGPHNLIINLSLCGQWAGADAVFAAASCPGTCVDYVNNNPAAFTNAYFDFKSLQVYV